MGQWVEAIVVSCCIFRVRDLFQINGLRACKASLAQNFPIPALLEHKVKEGKFEGIITGCVAVMSILLTPAQHLSMSTSMLRLFVIGNSFLFVGPNTVSACILLRLSRSGALSLADFYACERAKVRF